MTRRCVAGRTGSSNNANMSIGRRKKPTDLTAVAATATAAVR